jgi:hypothetical protein
VTTALLPDEPELGVQRYCRKCDEFWPDDLEFWSIRTRPAGTRNSSHGRPFVTRTDTKVYACRACRKEQQSAYARDRRRATA